MEHNDNVTEGSPFSGTKGSSGRNHTSVLEQETPTTTLIIGISGCSSSGKSTLAFLLSEIFNPSTSPSKEKPKVVTQDDFFRAKNTIPHTTFDEPPSRFLADSFKLFKQQGTETEGVESLYKIEKEEDGDGYRVSGPDTDCAAAVDFEALIRVVEGLRDRGGKDEGKERERERERERELRFVEENASQQKAEAEVEEEVQKAKIMHLNQEEEEMLWLLKTHMGLIHEMKGLVQKAFEERQGAAMEQQDGYIQLPPPNFRFIEGFLLFVPSHAPNHCPAPNESLQTTQARNKHRSAIMQNIHIPLFLPTSRETAKRRRLSRKIYVDSPEGFRYPGQMWKGEGYFEEVVWGGYVREFGWLLEGDDGKEGRKIWIRGDEDWGTERTVRWAVGVILEEAGELGWV